MSTTASITETNLEKQQKSQHNNDSGFSLARSHHIESLNITVDEYIHDITGATHYHIKSDNPENVFLNCPSRFNRGSPYT